MDVPQIEPHRRSAEREGGSAAPPTVRPPPDTSPPSASARASPTTCASSRAICGAAAAVAARTAQPAAASASPPAACPGGLADPELWEGEPSSRPGRLRTRDTGRAMSQENVEVVRRALQALADGGLDAMAEFWDPDIVWRAAEGAVDDVGEMHGRVAVRRYAQDWIETFDEISVVAEELRDVGDDRVLAIQRLSGRAKLSGTAGRPALRRRQHRARREGRAGAGVPEHR